MSKKTQNIDIEVNELKNQSLPTWEIIIPNKKKIGVIEKADGRYRAITDKTNKILFAKSFTNSMNDLLAYFVLHER